MKKSEISTSRLTITPWHEQDADAFFELTQDDGFNAYPITIYRQTSIDTARQWIRSAIADHIGTGLGKFGIWDKEGKILHGMGGLTPWSWEGERLVDVTYRLRQSAWGKGYGWEAAFALVNHGFSVGLDEVTATITPNNTPSLKIATRLGMKFNMRIILKGVDTDLYRLSRGDFVK